MQHAYLVKLNNSNVVFSPTVVEFIAPDFLENSSTVNAVSLHEPDLRYFENESEFFEPLVNQTSYPQFLSNSQTFPIAKMGNAKIVLEPTFITNTAVAFNPSVSTKSYIDFFINPSIPFAPSTASNNQVFPEFIDSTIIVRKPIAKLLPFVAPLPTPDQIIRPRGNLPVGERTTSDSTKTFKDFSLMFRPHPLTGDVTRVFDYDSVTQAIKVIIYTEFFERPFSSQQIASGVKSYLFEPNDALSRRELQEKISLSILRYEPRVILKNVSVNYDRENPNGVTVTITYKIRTFERTETFSLFLERV